MAMWFIAKLRSVKLAMLWIREVVRNVQVRRVDEKLKSLLATVFVY